MTFYSPTEISYKRNFQERGLRTFARRKQAKQLYTNLCTGKIRISPLHCKATIIPHPGSIVNSKCYFKAIAHSADMVYPGVVQAFYAITHDRFATLAPPDVNLAPGYVFMTHHAPMQAEKGFAWIHSICRYNFVEPPHNDYALFKQDNLKTGLNALAKFCDDHNVTTLDMTRSSPGFANIQPVVVDHFLFEAFKDQKITINLYMY